MRRILDILFDIFLRAREDAAERALHDTHPTVFAQVTIDYHRSVAGGLRFMLGFMVRVLIVFSPLFWFTDPVVLTVSFVALSLIVLSLYFAGLHYKERSGLGDLHDMRKDIESRFSLYVNDEGLYGQLRFSRDAIASVTRTGDRAVSIALKEYLLLPRPSGHVTVHFQTPDDAATFVDLLQKGAPRV